MPRLRSGTRPYKPRNGKLRDLSDVRSKRVGTSLSRRGKPKSSIAPAFQAALESNQIVLFDRRGRRVDMRTIVGRRFRDLIDNLISDLGGVANCTTAELQLLQRAAALGVELERQEADFINGNDDLDPATYASLAALQQRLLVALGLKRRAKDISPRLCDIIDGTAEAAE